MKYLMILILILLPACAGMNTRDAITLQEAIEVSERIETMTYLEVCETWDERADDWYVNRIPDFVDRMRVQIVKTSSWPAATKERILAKRIAMGMNERMVRTAWGEPGITTTTATTLGTYRHLRWGAGNYIMLRDNKVVQIGS